MGNRTVGAFERRWVVSHHLTSEDREVLGGESIPFYPMSTVVNNANLLARGTVVLYRYNLGRNGR